MQDYIYSPADAQGETAENAAISVAVMIVVVTLLLTGMKKSGFRAMVAVGRG